MADWSTGDRGGKHLISERPDSRSCNITAVKTSFPKLPEQGAGSATDSYCAGLPIATCAELMRPTVPRTNPTGGFIFKQQHVWTPGVLLHLTHRKTLGKSAHALPCFRVTIHTMGIQLPLLKEWWKDSEQAACRSLGGRGSRSAWRLCYLVQSFSTSSGWPELILHQHFDTTLPPDLHLLLKRESKKKSPSNVKPVSFLGM